MNFINRYNSDKKSNTILNFLTKTFIKTSVSLIVCHDCYGGIGKKGTIPWYIHKDLCFFRDLTKNNVVIMGSKTFSSLGYMPLRNRINIVITKTIKKYKTMEKDFSNLFIVSSIEEALIKSQSYNKNIYVIGGSKIYSYFLDNYDYLIDKIYITKINHDFKCDTFWPYRSNQKNLYESQPYYFQDPKVLSPIKYSFNCEKVNIKLSKQNLKSFMNILKLKIQKLI